MEKDLGHMDYEQDVAQELASFIAENTEAISVGMIETYHERYPQTKGDTLDAMRPEWNRRIIAAMKADVLGDVDPNRWRWILSLRTCAAADYDDVFAPIQVFIASEMWNARVVASLLGRQHLHDPARLTQLYACLERSVIASIRANMESFLQTTAVSGAISSSWGFVAADFMPIETPATPDMPEASGTPGMPVAPVQSGSGRAPDVPTVIAGLSLRESQVLALVVGGKTNKQIAAALDLKPTTVKNYLSHLLAKIGVTNRTELVALALKAGVV